MKKDDVSELLDAVADSGLGLPRWIGRAIVKAAPDLPHDLKRAIDSSGEMFQRRLHEAGTCGFGCELCAGEREADLPMALESEALSDADRSPGLAAQLR